MEPSSQRIRVNGVELCLFEWGHPQPGQPTFLLAHATGFHARCWDQVVRHLGPQHILAVDQRGHGRSEAPGITHWEVFGQDLAEIVRARDLTNIVGVGHSMGGHAMTQAAAWCPERFTRILLIDPVIASPDDYGPGGWTLSPPPGSLHPTAKRKSRFASPQAMIDRFRDRPPYANFLPECLRDYCTYGLLPAPDGDGCVLACSPATEASVYMTSRSNPGIYDSARSLEIPTLIVRAKLPLADRQIMDFSSSPTWPGLAGEFRQGREIFLADRTHFIPLETPEYVADLILRDDPGEGS
ncbi:MAG: alpha/beta hydrolase [Candidatus Binatia bacterium]|nr:alpha/beta hydrolase [Candidatus Binatia bacterium]